MGTISFDFNFWTLSLLLLNFGLALFVAFSNRHKAAADELHVVKTMAADELNAVKSSLRSDIKGVQDDVKSIDQQVSKQGQRLAAIEADVENGITKEDLAAVYNRVNEVVQATLPMKGRLEEISKGMERIDKHLIELLRK